jgi:hypothetical protein
MLTSRGHEYISSSVSITYLFTFFRIHVSFFLTMLFLYLVLSLSLCVFDFLPFGRLFIASKIFCMSVNQVKEDEMGRVCSTNGEKGNTHRILVGKPEGKTPLGRPRRRWVDNIKIEIKELGWDGIDWIDLTQDRDQWRALVNTIMNLRFP